MGANPHCCQKDLNVKMINNLVEKYYKNQERHHGLNNKKDFEKQAKPWLDAGTIDSWRHERMYAFTDSLTKSNPHSRWLTVGDGRYGCEAHYLIEHGVNVLATDINIDLLKDANGAKYINSFKRENAEKLSFDDNTFDFVLCKESYHHFPRPIIALYEMLRVAKKAIVLIEPNDVKKRGFSWSRFWSVDTLNTQVNRFEVSGNYVYSVSRREIEKVAFGIGLPAIAFAGVDDIYIKSAGSERVGDNTFNYMKIRLLLWILEICYRLGIRDRSLLVSVIFKEKPSLKIINELNNYGYNVRLLPKNPYVK